MRITAFDRQTGQMVILLPRDVPAPDVPMDERRYVDVRIEPSGTYVPVKVGGVDETPEFVAAPTRRPRDPTRCQSRGLIPTGIIRSVVYGCRQGMTETHNQTQTARCCA